MAPKRRLAVPALLAAAALLGACTSSQDARHAGDHGAVLHNPSPAMASLAERQSDRLNRQAKAWDTDLRMIHGDLARTILYSHEPSRLTPTTKPY